MIAAQERSGRIFQVGSQYVSSLVYQKARELLQAGAIGQLNMVEAWLDRNTAIGAWQYSIPPDASPANIDWDRFLGNAPKVPVRARAPVPLAQLPGLRHRRRRRPVRAPAQRAALRHRLARARRACYATGGLRYWKDGRDVPDVMLAMLDYPSADDAIRSSPWRCA